MKDSTNQLFFADWKDPAAPSRLVAGTDEAGRGPLAGPVVAGAVLFPPDLDPAILAGITDSKLLTEAEREQGFELIVTHALSYAIAEVSAQRIDQINIRRASLLAMKEAVARLNPQPGFVLVDGRDYPDIPIPGEAVIQGDRLHTVIGAASILAKVSRDRTMTDLHRRYPQYGFDQHKGYPTRFHKTAVALFGPCSEHRRTFAGVKEHLRPSVHSPVLRVVLDELEAIQSLPQLEAFHCDLLKRGLRELEVDYLVQRLQGLRKTLRMAERARQPATVDRGAYWEGAVTTFLQAKGYHLLERNFRGPHGEIDIITEQAGRIVFIEVKARRSAAYGMPYEAVTPKKQKAIITTAEVFLYQRGWSDQKEVRYDIISVLYPKNAAPQITHIEDAFRVEDPLD